MQDSRPLAMHRTNDRTVLLIANFYTRVSEVPGSDSTTFLATVSEHTVHPSILLIQTSLTSYTFLSKSMLFWIVNFWVISCSLAPIFRVGQKFTVETPNLKNIRILS
jgi:hypothetical protein